MTLGCLKCDKLPKNDILSEINNEKIGVTWLAVIKLQ